jgi:hypothetical protein
MLRDTTVCEDDLVKQALNVIKLESTEGSIERNRKMGKVIPRQSTSREADMCENQGSDPDMIGGIPQYPMQSYSVFT